MDTEKLITATVAAVVGSLAKSATEPVAAAESASVE